MQNFKRLSVLQWKENPLLQLLVFSCGGKVCYDFILPSALHLLVVGLCLGMVCWIFYQQRMALRFHKSIRYLRSFSIWLACVWMGTVISSLHYKPILPIEGNSFSCTIEENLGETTPGRWRLVAVINTVRNAANWTNEKEKVILNVDGHSAHWQHGDRLLVAEPLNLMEPPAIPGQFNAQKFYHRQGIDYQVWTKAAFIKLLPEKSANPIKSIAFQIRTWMENQIIEALPKKDDAYMMNALLLGIRRKIDPELKAAYSAAGVTHILAVSGMHVGLILWFLRIIFGWMKRSRQGQISFSIVIITLLWFYALITGLSPSVLRAVTVFSIMQFSDVLKKAPLPINSLCLATLILFGFQPDIIYDVGYQLSFSAVYGIISFLGPLEEIWKHRKVQFMKAPGIWFLQEGWSAVTISLAATLGTFPIILFYFHQFPTYFLLANLIAVPISTGLIFGAIGILILSPFPVLSHALGWLSGWVIWLLNSFVVWVSKLPFSLLDDVFLYLPQISLILAALIFLQLWLRTRSQKALNTSLVFILVCCISNLAVNAFRWKKKPEIFALHAKAGWQWGHIQHRTLTLATLEPTASTESELPIFEIRALKEGFQTIYVETPVPEFKVISVGKKDSTQKTIAGVVQGNSFVLLGNYLNFITRRKAPIDFLIVERGGTKTLSKALQLFSPKEVWLKVNPKKMESWKSVVPEGVKIRNFWKEKFQRM